MKWKNVIFVLIGLVLVSSLGLSWQAGYNNRVQINVSSASTTYSGVAVPFILNSTILGINPCKDTHTCNDSLVTDASDNAKYHYIEYYNASDNFRLFINVTSYSPSGSTYYFYYNNSNLTRPPTYKGSRVFYRVNDFENYTNDTRVSSDFGVFTLPANEPRTLTDCYKGGSCIVQTNYDGIVYGVLTYSYSSGILEYRYKTSLPDHNDATFYIRAGLNGTDAGAVASIGNLLLAGDVWTKIKIEWLTDGTVDIIWDNANGLKSVNIAGTNFSQLAFPLYSLAIMPMYLDNFILRQSIENATVSYGAIENAPPIPDSFTFITPISPDLENQTSNPITFMINVSGSNALYNCSLYINGSLNSTNYDIANNSQTSWSLTMVNRSYVYNYSCVGSIANNTPEYPLNVMVAYPFMTFGNCPLSTLPNEFTKVYCSNNNTLYREKLYTMSGSGGAFINCNYSEVVDCAYGCEGGKCNLSLEVARTNMFYLIILLFVAILIVVMIVKFYR